MYPFTEKETTSSMKKVMILLLFENTLYILDHREKTDRNKQMKFY